MTEAPLDLSPAPLRLRLDGAALAANWRAMARLSGSAACGAAVKASAYGLGAREVVRRLRTAGCRDFFVATWREAAEIADLVEGASLSVLHGVRDADMPLARAGFARPVLVSAEQVARWRAADGGPCDLMVDTGMNRLGLRADEVGAAMTDELPIVTVMSHLADADEDSPRNEAQRGAFADVARSVRAQRYSLANSAGVFLGSRFAFDLTRPGLALYGGHPRARAEEVLRPVVEIEAQVVQRRCVPAGERVGYGGTWRADRDSDIAILNLGYADGFLRVFGGGVGAAVIDGARAPIIGRVSMDLIAIAIPHAAEVGEGDWVALDYDLPQSARATGLSQYELLTLLGGRGDRLWK